MYYVPITKSATTNELLVGILPSISGGNADYIEALYKAYLESPNNVDQDWRDYFDKLPKVDGNISPDISHATVKAHFLDLARQYRGAVSATVSDSLASDHERKQIRVLQLISAYRQRGIKRQISIL